MIRACVLSCKPQIIRTFRTSDPMVAARRAAEAACLRDGDDSELYLVHLEDGTEYSVQLEDIEDLGPACVELMTDPHDMDIPTFPARRGNSPVRVRSRPAGFTVEHPTRGIVAGPFVLRSETKSAADRLRSTP